MEPMNTCDWIDQTAIENLRRLDKTDGQESLTKFFALFKTTVQQELNDLQNSFENKEWPAFKKKIHNLKSTAGYMGAKKMVRTCQEIEMGNSQQPQWTAISSKLKLLFNEFETTVRLLNGVIQ